MMKKTHLERSARWAIVLLFAGLAAYLTARSTSLYGVGLSPDSTEYIRLARDISADGLAFLSEPKAILQPPFYPLILASISTVTGSPVLNAATWLNVVVAAALVTLIVVTASKFSTSIPVLALVGVLSCFSIPLTAVWSMAWTEPVFILIVYLVFLVITGPKQSPIAAICAGLLTAAACLTRYSGIVLLPVVSAHVFFATAGHIWRRCKSAMLYALPPIAIVALYVLRNYRLSGTPLGFRVPSNVGLTPNVDRAMGVILGWFLPWRVLSFSSLMFVGAFVLGGVVWSQRRHLARIFLHPPSVLSLYTSFAFAYAAFIIWTSTTTAYDPIDNRLLSPVYPSLLVLLAAVLEPHNWRSRYASLAVVSMCFVVLASTPVQSAYLTIDAKARNGAGGYNSRSWQESEVIGYFRHSAPPEIQSLFSNAPDALYILADVEAKLSPRHRFAMNSDVTTGVTATNLFECYPSLDGALLVWCDLKSRGYLFTPEDLQTMSRIDRIHAFSDGAIYRIKSSNNRIESDK